MLTSMNINFTNSQVDIPSAGMAGSIGVTNKATSAASATRNCAGKVCVENIGRTVNIAPTRANTMNQVVRAEITVN